MTSRATAPSGAVLRPLRVVEEPQARDLSDAAGRQRPAAASQGKPGPKPPRPFTDAQIEGAWRGLRLEIETAFRIAQTQKVVPPISGPLEAAVLAYLSASNPHRDDLWRLAHTARVIADGSDVDHALGMLAQFKLPVKRSRALDAALARKYTSKWGKAYKLFTVIAKGIVDFPKRREPTPELIEMFERSRG